MELRKVTLRLARQRSWASLSIEFTWPCTGKGKISTWGIGESMFKEFVFLETRRI